MSTSITLARAYFDAWNAHDTDAIAALFAADGTFWDTQMAAPAAVADVKSGFAAFLADTPDLRFEVSLIAETTDGRAIAEWVIRGTSKATGKPFATPGADVFDIRDGKIAAARAYLNPNTLTG